MLALQVDYHIKEKARMKYLNVQAILPDALVKSCKLMFKTDIFMSQSSKNS